MKTFLFVAPLAATLTSIASAEVLAGSQKAIQNIAAPAPHVVTGSHPTSSVIEKTVAPTAQASKWTWIPAQRNGEGAPQTQIVAIPVPAPGAAALIGLSGLIVARRRHAA